MGIQYKRLGLMTIPYMEIMGSLDQRYKLQVPKYQSLHIPSKYFKVFSYPPLPYAHTHHISSQLFPSNKNCHACGGVRDASTHLDQFLMA